MSDDENISAIPVSLKRKASGIGTGPRKRPAPTDPYVFHGRHIGRTVLLMCNVDNIINTGLLRLGSDESDLEYTAEEERAWNVFNTLLEIVPCLQNDLAKEDSVNNKRIAELIQKGINNARADDTRTLKNAILEWITEPNTPLDPPLSRTFKGDRGFHHPVTGALLCPASLNWNNPEVRSDLRDNRLVIPGDQWPSVLWHDRKYDKEAPWQGFLKNEILVKAFKHVFLSPSSLDKEPRATRSCNARMHGMTEVNTASLAYISTQVRFAIHSSSVFSRTDTITDSERFYFSVLDVLDNPTFTEEASSLIKWWNRRIFPNASKVARPITAGSAMANMLEKGALRERNSES